MKPLLALWLMMACSNHDGAARADEGRIQAAKARHGPTIRTRIERAREIDRLFESMPAPAFGEGPPTTDPPLSRDNTDLVRDSGLMMFNTGALVRGSTALGYTEPTQDLAALETTLERAARVTYVAVMKSTWYSPPVPDLAKRVYTGGWARADVVVFDLRSEPPPVIGAFRVDAELTGAVRVRAGDGVKAVMEDLDSALADATYRAVNERLAR